MEADFVSRAWLEPAPTRKAVEHCAGLLIRTIEPDIAEAGYTRWSLFELSVTAAPSGVITLHATPTRAWDGERLFASTVTGLLLDALWERSHGSV